MPRVRWLEILVDSVAFERDTSESRSLDDALNCLIDLEVRMLFGEVAPTIVTCRSMSLKANIAMLRDNRVLVLH
ncbi:unnamed protein product [Acidithrix sp. C25]|nr:unnamed protein product [Acidithrix sp. C25]